MNEYMCSSHTQFSKVFLRVELEAAAAGSCCISYLVPGKLCTFTNSLLSGVCACVVFIRIKHQTVLATQQDENVFFWENKKEKME